MIETNKKFNFAVAIACIFSLVGIWFCRGVQAVANVHSRVFVVAIDAGHGGIDAGVLGVKTKTKESHLNLQIARILKDKFISSGIEVVMTRNSYGGLYGTTAKGFKKRDLQKRVKIINEAKPDAMVSIHLNYYSSPLRRGATTFFGKGKLEGEKLAKSIQKHFNLLSSQNRDYSAICGDYYLLNEAQCPSVICECGFLSNEEDEKLLLTAEYQNEIVEKIFFGVVEYLTVKQTQN